MWNHRLPAPSRRLLTALTLGALTVGAIGTPAAAATTRMVDDDGRASPGRCDGNGMAAKKIQNAVAAASAGDTILVCPGTYREQVVIGPAKDRLTLRSAVHLKATIQSPGDLVKRLDATAVVLIRQGADQVTVQGFRLKHVAAVGSSVDPTGQVGGDPFGDCGINFGIQVDGTRARIVSNQVRASGPGTLTDCGMAYGIGVGYNDGDGSDGDGASANVRFNSVRDPVLAGVVAGGYDTSMTAFRNVVRYHHTKAERPDRRASPSASSRHPGFGRLPKVDFGGRIAGGRPSIEGEALGVAIFFGATGKLIGNTAESGPAAGPLASGGRPYLYAAIAAMEPRGGVIIKDNRAYRAFAGILAGAATLSISGGPRDPMVVRGNLAVQNQYGIFVDPTVGGTVTGNRANSNVFGLVLGFGTSGNAVTNNRALNNLQYDCGDQTGPDVGSIDNTWADNVGFVSEPQGLCDQPFPNN